MAAGYRGQRRSAADRLHGRHLRPRVAGPGRRARHPRQLRLARHDRPARRSGARPRHHAADQSRLRPRPQPEDEHRRRAIEARHLARAARRLPAAGRSSRPGASPACTCTSARAPTWSTCRRSAARWRSWPREVGRSLTTISAGGGLPVPYRDGQTRTSIWTRTSSCGTRRASGWKTRSATRCALEIEPGRYLVAESGYLVTRDPRRQADGRQHVLSARRRLQQPGPADPVRRLSSDVDRAGRRRRRDRGRCTTWSSAGRCANRATSSRRRKGASSARASCRRPRSASSW